MIDRHAVKQMLGAGIKVKDAAEHFGVTRRTIERIRSEPAVTEVEEAAARRARGVGRPPILEAVRERILALMKEDPEAPPLEVLRLLREEGTELGESTFYRVYRIEHGRLPKELMVRFEGVPGEFLQFDFGQVDVRLPEGRKQRMHFAAARLKYSRWVWVVLVPNERVECRSGWCSTGRGRW